MSIYKTDLIEWNLDSNHIFLIQFEYQIINGIKSPTSFTVSVKDRSIELNARYFRTIPFASLFNTWAQNSSDPSVLVPSNLDGPKRGYPISGDILNTVISLYNEALSLRLPPTKYVATRMSISHSTAAKRITRARRLGLLAPLRNRTA